MKEEKYLVKIVFLLTTTKLCGTSVKTEIYRSTSGENPMTNLHLTCPSFLSYTVESLHHGTKYL